MITLIHTGNLKSKKTQTEGRRDEFPRRQMDSIDHILAVTALLTNLPQPQGRAPGAGLSLIGFYSHTFLLGRQFLG